MKKIYLTLMAIFAIIQCSYAQPYLPLSAGSGQALTGDLYIGGSRSIVMNLAGGNVNFNVTNAGSGDNLMLQYNASGVLKNQFYTNGNSFITGGNLGIGTISPTVPLQVNGTILTTTSDYTRLSTGSALTIQTAGTTGNTYALIQQAQNGGTTSGDISLNPFGGNVGIGTSAPTRKLSVHLSSGTGNVISWGNVGGGDYGALGFDANGSYLSTFAGNSGLYLKGDNGNVGIGTMNPGYKFDVQTTGGGPQINVQAGTTSNGSIAYNTTLGSWAMGVGVGTAQNVFNLVSGNTEVMRIMSSGNVGIGTTSPFSRLHVQNDSNTGTIALGSNLYPGLLVSSAATGEFRIDNRASAAGGYISFFPNGEGNVTGSEAMRIGTNGNVGIGTTGSFPDYKLSVNGKIRSTEVRVETGWADYVFDKDYKLKSIREVEAYIKDNHHLPDVPSAAEVEKNGVALGETSSLLLKKIEELTLYLIEKDKQLTTQKNEITDLKTAQKILEAKIENY